MLWRFLDEPARRKLYCVCIVLLRSCTLRRTNIQTLHGDWPAGPRTRQESGVIIGRTMTIGSVIMSRARDGNVSFDARSPQRPRRHRQVRSSFICGGLCAVRGPVARSAMSRRRPRGPWGVVVVAHRDAETPRRRGRTPVASDIETHSHERAAGSLADCGSGQWDEIAWERTSGVALRMLHANASASASANARNVVVVRAWGDVSGPG